MTPPKDRDVRTEKHRDRSEDFDEDTGVHNGATSRKEIRARLGDIEQQLGELKETSTKTSQRIELVEKACTSMTGDVAATRAEVSTLTRLASEEREEKRAIALAQIKRDEAIAVAQATAATEARKTDLEAKKLELGDRKETRAWWSKNWKMLLVFLAPIATAIAGYYFHGDATPRPPSNQGSAIAPEKG